MPVNASGAPLSIIWTRLPPLFLRFDRPGGEREAGGMDTADAESRDRMTGPKRGAPGTGRTQGSSLPIADRLRA
ncbi:hypothetical protein K9B33_08750 [Sphingobium sp. 3R8]|uniref:hypothetical protein n=1 Tax=Sphingobium sp. 3R8 TaxID=2874921 RepID=UPI001CC9873B|nr:hypothetical protein [Sphingobium sp. 3R8]MBZ9647629.1 hypothetical protein [Sphingobium sp. 3R8]